MNTGIDKTRRYVFGTSSPSADYNDHIRPYSATTAPVTESAIDYMTNGGGRFALPSTFAAVDRFFLDNTLLPGSYSVQELSDRLNLDNSNYFDDFQIGISQYGTGLNPGESYDLAERAFVYGSTRFYIVKKPELKFHVASDGEKFITGLEIKPENDSFKFSTDEGIADAANQAILGPSLDPFNLSRGSLGILYEGPGREYSLYGNREWELDQYQGERDISISSNSDSALRNAAGIAMLLDSEQSNGQYYYQELLNDEFLSYVKSGKKVVYGTPSGDLITTDDAKLGVLPLTSGYYFVGGEGRDTIVGSARGDVLLGGAGNDTLRGGLGNDRFVGGTADDTIEGGSLAFGLGGGSDVAVFSGAINEYRITYLGNGSYEVADKVAGRDGTDTLIGVEKGDFNGDVRNLTDSGQDIAFVVDTTGSMDDDLAAVKARAKEIIGAIFAGENGSINSRIAVVGYNDPETTTILPFTSQPSLSERESAALSAINSLSASGGGDFPEAVNAGLLRALDGRAGEWRQDASARRIILFGDAPPKDEELRERVLELARNTRISGTGSASSAPAPAIEGDAAPTIEGDIATDRLSDSLAVTRFSMSSGSNEGNVTSVPVEIFTVLIGDDSTTAADFENLASATGGETLNASGSSDLVDLILSSITFNSNQGTPNDDIFEGTDEDDLFSGLAGDDQLEGKEGNDVLQGDDGNDNIKGDGGDDILYGGAGNDVLYGGTGNDYLSDYYGNNNLYGQAGNDTLYGGIDDDLLDGGDGDDFLSGGTGDNTLDGAQGKDAAVYEQYETQIDTIKKVGDAVEVVVNNQLKDTLENVEYIDLVDTWVETQTLRRVSTATIGGTTYGVRTDDRLVGGNGDNRIDARSGDDELLGKGGNDTLFGGDGADYIEGGKGNDTIHAGAGNDKIEGTGEAGSGNDIIYGGDGDDSIEDNSGNNQLYGEAGNDNLEGGNGRDTLDGGSGNDYIRGFENNDIIYGGDGNDQVEGSGAAGYGDDIIYGGAGDDNLEDNHGNNRIYGDAGNDTIEGGIHNDYVEGGSGNDYIGTGSGNDIIEGTGEAGYGDDIIYGGDGDDTIEDNSGNNKLYGQDGNDNIEGGSGVDYIEGGSGNDYIRAGGGDDRVEGAGYSGYGDDIIYGGDGDDNLEDNHGNNRVYGENGNDLLEGGYGQDLLDGGNGNDYIRGGDSDDELLGGAGEDSIEGGRGNDLIKAGHGDDHVEGDGAAGYGDDTIYGGEGNDNLEDNSGNNKIYGENGNDRLESGSGRDRLDGGSGNDYLRSGDGDDELIGGSGNDILDGGRGADTLTGGSGDDLLIGDSNDDYLIGGPGIDTLRGGSGNDTFELQRGAGHDIIEDFGHDRDRLALAEGISYGSLSFSQSGSDAIISLGSDMLARLSNTGIGDINRHSAFGLQPPVVTNINRAVLIDKTGG